MKPYNIIIVLLALNLFCGCCRQQKLPVWEECVFMPQIYLWEGSVENNEEYPRSFYNFGKEDKQKFIVLVQGDCSYCLGKIKTWEEYFNIYKEEYKNVAAAVVVYTDDLIILEYNLEKINPSLPIYLDTMRSFEQSNNIKPTARFFVLLDTENKVLYSSVDKEEKMKKSHRKMMKILK